MPCRGAQPNLLSECTNPAVNGHPPLTLQTPYYPYCSLHLVSGAPKVTWRVMPPTSKTGACPVFQQALQCGCHRLCLPARWPHAVDILSVTSCSSSSCRCVTLHRCLLGSGNATSQMGGGKQPPPSVCSPPRHRNPSTSVLQENQGLKRNFSLFSGPSVTLVCSLFRNKQPVNTSH